MYTKEISFSRRMKQAEQHAASLLQQILIFVLIFLVIFMMVQIQNLHGTAHVVNYAGLVRGATQREVKLEITGTADDMQIEYLDKILSGLKYEDGNYNLVSLKDPAYQQCLDNQIEYWELLKEEIYTVREKGYENTNVVSMSETYFEYADETVTAAEQYSEKIAARIRLTEIISALDILLLIFLIVQQQIQHIQAVRENYILSKKAYLDVHTGLPNKSRCEDLLNSSGFITEPLCFVMFDLNNLKEVNDTLGHAAGDSMIANFAHILRKVVPEKDFVGRYGGDEFIAILYDTTSGQADELLEKLHATIKQYHSSNMPDAISYAYGYSYSMNYKDCTLRNLLDKADHEMYLNKQAQKKKRYAVSFFVFLYHLRICSSISGIPTGSVGILCISAGCIVCEIIHTIFHTIDHIFTGVANTVHYILDHVAVFIHTVVILVLILCGVNIIFVIACGSVRIVIQTVFRACVCTVCAIIFIVCIVISAACDSTQR